MAGGGVVNVVLLLVVVDCTVERRGDFGPTVSELPFVGLHTYVFSPPGEEIVAMALRRLAAAAADAAADAPNPTRVGDADAARYADAGGGEVKCDMASLPPDAGGACGAAEAAAGVNCSLFVAAAAGCVDCCCAEYVAFALVNGALGLVRGRG